jgi:hypothetical protein
MSQDQDQELERELFYALTDKPELSAHRSAKLLALLLGRLVADGVLDESAVRALLLEALH